MCLLDTTAFPTQKWLKGLAMNVKREDGPVERADIKTKKSILTRDIRSVS